MGSHANAAGAAGAGQHRLKWRHFSPALTIGEIRLILGLLFRGVGLHMQVHPDQDRLRSDVQPSRQICAGEGVVRKYAYRTV